VSELPEGVTPAEVPPARESASGILLHRVGDRWELLLGVRSRKSRFLPGHLACPGGGVDPVDRPSEPGAYLRCVRRELVEEIGVDVPEEAWIEAGERITPPLFPIRFRTRFFVSLLPAGIDASRLEPASAENEALRFARPEEVLGEWDRGELKLPPPVLPILRTLAGADGLSPPDVARRIAEANAREELAPRIEFAPDVWVVPVHTPTLPPATHTNVWIVGGRRFVIVDPGSSEETEIARLTRVVERRRERGDVPVAILLTHLHRDHIGGVAEVARALNLEVRAHPLTLEALAAMPGSPSVAPLNDGEDIDLDGMTVRPVLTPGHARGHLAFHLPEPRLLVAGDLVSGLSTILIHPEHGDMNAYLDSLARAERLDCRMLLPGHGPPLPGSALSRVARHREEREERIEEILGAEPLDLNEIARQAYEETPGLPAMLTESQSLAHLLRMEGQGRARRAGPSKRRWLRG